MTQAIRKLLYSTNTDSDDISVVDTVARVELTRIPVGGSPRGSVRFDKAGNFGYVSNTAGNSISVIDLLRNREAARITVGLSPRGLILSEDDRFAFVANSGSNSLSVVDLRQRHQVAEIAMGVNPRHMAILPRSNRILVSEWGSDAIGILDYSRGGEAVSRSRSIGVGTDARPYSLTVNSAGERGYVANTQADYMSIIDVNSGTELSRVTVGYGGRAIALSPDENFAFISVEPDNQIRVVDLSQDQVVHSVTVGASPRGITLDKDTNELFVAPFQRSVSPVGSRNAISIVDASDPLTAHYVGEVKVGLGPCSVSILNR